VIQLGKFWYFGKLVAEVRWSLTRGGGNRRVSCIEDIARWCEDMNFEFKWQEQYLVLATRTHNLYLRANV